MRICVYLSMPKLKLRIKEIKNHPRYRYMISGLRVNGKRRRLFFVELRDAKEELERLEIKARREGQARPEHQ